MRIDANLAAKCGEARETRAEKAIRLLMSLDGDPKHQKLVQFETFYPAVRHAISRKVPRKAILKHLSDGGLKLYPALYEEFLALLGGRHEEQTGISSCIQCGQPIPKALETQGALTEGSLPESYESNDAAGHEGDES